MKSSTAAGFLKVDFDGFPNCDGREGNSNTQQKSFTVNPNIVADKIA